ncbi:unnamed protein product, partial [Meganyctiphanes norvegica]
FNITTCRPKVLPCGHSFCTSCLHHCITEGRNECSMCREPHYATNVDQIPGNVAMEDLLQKWSPSVAVMNVKEDTLKEAQKSIDCFESATNYLETIISENNDRIMSKEAQIQTLLNEIEEDKRVRDQAQAAQQRILESRSIHSEIVGCVEEVQRATEKKAILQGCHELQTKIENMSFILKDIEEKEPILR